MPRSTTEALCTNTSFVVADNAAKLRAYREESSDHWEDLTAELLKELSVSHTAIGRAIDAVGEQYAALETYTHSNGGGRVKGA